MVVMGHISDLAPATEHVRCNLVMAICIRYTTLVPSMQIFSLQRSKPFISKRRTQEATTAR